MNFSDSLVGDQGISVARNDCLSSNSTSTNNSTGRGNELVGGAALVVIDYLNYFLLPSLLVVGLTGNSLTIIVMNSRRFSQQTSRLFLTALALSDTTLLLTQIYNKSFVINLIGTDIRALSEVGCKIFFIIFKTSKMTSSWFLVFLCLERFVAVWFPLKAKVICTKRIALSGIFAVYLVIGTYTTVWSYASKIDNKGLCHPDIYDRTNPDEVRKFGRFIMGGISLYSVVPTAFLITLTPLIIFKLARRTRMNKKLTGKIRTRQIETNKITVMLLGVMIAYIVLILPVTGLHLSAYLLRTNAFGTSSLGFMIFREVSQILEQINYAINFFLYVVTSKTFRGALKSVLLRIKSKICVIQCVIVREDASQKYRNSGADISTNNSTSETNSRQRSSRVKHTPSNESQKL